MEVQNFDMTAFVSEVDRRIYATLTNGESMFNEMRYMVKTGVKDQQRYLFLYKTVAQLSLCNEPSSSLKFPRCFADKLLIPYGYGYEINIDDKDSYTVNVMNTIMGVDTTWKSRMGINFESF